MGSAVARRGARLTARAGAGALAALALACAAACGGRRVAIIPDSVFPIRAVERPRVFVVRAEQLATAAGRVRAGDAALRPAYERLLRDADSALALRPLSVTQKRRTPSSGDAHDFMSMAPYWWPDSTRPGGLPYVRRDGQRNPESRLDSDDERFNTMERAVSALALAYRFSGDERYARHAATLLRAWFLDPATRMNPNLRFAQAVPGVSEGRSFGIIETHNMTELVDAVGLLRGSASWTDADQRALVAWSRDFLAWLRDSPLGVEERAARNNHGSWYDAQVAALALFVGDSALARQVIGESARARIAAHVRPDGSQPEELARTRSLSYSLFNLEALARLAEMGRHVGVDLWAYEAPGGGSLRRAYAYLAPFADPARRWPGEQLTPVSPSEFHAALRRAVHATGDSTLRAALATVPDAPTRADRVRLLFPDAGELR